MSGKTAPQNAASLAQPVGSVAKTRCCAMDNAEQRTKIRFLWDFGAH